jgi:hypothetical protein
VVCLWLVLAREACSTRSAAELASAEAGEIRSICAPETRSISGASRRSTRIVGCGWPRA